MNQSLGKIAKDLVEEASVIELIYHTAKSFAPGYDPDKVFEQLKMSKRKFKTLGKCIENGCQSF